MPHNPDDTPDAFDGPWKEEGAEEAARNAVLQILDARFGPVDDEISKTLAGIHDLQTLEQLIRTAAMTGSRDSFARALAP